MEIVKQYLKRLKENWIVALQLPNLKYQLLFTLIAYVFAFRFCRYLMAEFEIRQGSVISDPFLELLPTFDLSMITFVLTYMALTMFFLTILQYPKLFLRGVQGYVLLLLMRTFTIYLVPLEPPVDIIVLQDPITKLFLESKDGGYIVKDLFFSGHVSAIVFFYFIVRKTSTIIKNSLLILATLVGLFVLIQHVHYTIDVVAAPFFAYIAFLASGQFQKYFSQDAFETNKSAIPASSK